jgi:hypothetical protein
VKVTIVLDPAFELKDLAVLGDAFWLVESPVNRALAERLWAAGRFDRNSAVFKASDVSREEAAINAYFDVIEHHPSATEIFFVGAELSHEIRAELTGAELIPVDGGFVASRATTDA